MKHKSLVRNGRVVEPRSLPLTILLVITVLATCGVLVWIVFNIII